MSPTGFEKVHWHLSIVCLAKSPRYHSRRRISSANHTSCPRSAVIVQCACGFGAECVRYCRCAIQKLATTASHKFFRPRACFRPKTACTLRCRRAGRAADRRHRNGGTTCPRLRHKHQESSKVTPPAAPPPSLPSAPPASAPGLSSSRCCQTRGS